MFAEIKSVLKSKKKKKKTKSLWHFAFPLAVCRGSHCSMLINASWKTKHKYLRSPKQMFGLMNYIKENIVITNIKSRKRILPDP